MFKKHWILLIQKDNLYANTVIRGSVSLYLAKVRRDRIAVINFWKITRREYKKFIKEMKNV